MLNKPSGNMYEWCYTWNPLRGRCHHDCSYCYVEKLRQRGLKKFNGEPAFDENAFKDSLIVPQDKVVFVQSCGDLLGYWIEDTMIWRVLSYLKKFPQTTFLLQTKNPERFFDLGMPQNCMLGTTLETNRDTSEFSKAPSPKERYHVFMQLKYADAYPLMLSFEPLLDFDLDILVQWCKDIQPEFVSVGADSMKCGLPEPTKEKVDTLVGLLSSFTEVRLKKNLERLRRCRV